MIDLRKPLFATYAFVNQRGWLDHRWAKVVFREAYFLYKKYYEDPFWRLTKRHPALFSGGHILDVGANIGYTAMCFARVVDDDCRVYAFEPEAINFRALSETAARRSIQGRIEAIKAAVGEAKGFVDLWINDEHHADHRIVTEAYEGSERDLRKREKVAVTSMDDFAREHGIIDRIAFVKMDVQGYELLVCRGMQHTLEANPRIVVAVEYSPEHLVELGFQPQQLLDFFRERAFHPYALSRRRHDPVLRKWDWTTMDPEGYMDVLFSRVPLIA